MLGLLQKEMIPKSLESLTQCSMDIIDNASPTQIEAAMKYNKLKIDKLLLKLLTIEWISNNKQQFINEQNKIIKTEELNNNTYTFLHVF